MNRGDELNNIVLGCLVHHLDDLSERLWGDGEAPLEVKDTVERIEVLCGLETWRALIARSSRLACGRDDAGSRLEEHLPLVSILSSVSMDGELPSQVGWFSPQALQKTPIYPKVTNRHAINSIGSEDYRPVCEGLFKDMRELLNKGVFSPNLVALLMQKYCSFIPHRQVASDDTNEPLPDVPLFDHLKLTAGFGVCLHGCATSQNVPLDEVDKIRGEYLFVLGDLSGVQNFVYTISSRGALKTLRARSFFLELLTLHVVERIVEECNISPLNVLYATGGLFSVLVPKTGQIGTQLNRIRDDINSYLANLHDSGVYLAMEYSDPSDPFRDPDFLASEQFDRFAEKIHGVHQKVGSAKRQRFIDELGGEPSRRERYMGPFLPDCTKSDVKSVAVDATLCVRCGKSCSEPASLEVQIEGRLGPTTYTIHGCAECLGEDVWQDKETGKPKSGECSVCHKESAFLLTLPEPWQSANEKESVPACLFCNLLYHMGEHLPMAASAVIVRKKDPPSYKESKAFVFIEDYYYYLKIVPDETDDKPGSYIWGINQPDPLKILKLCEVFEDRSMTDRISAFMMARHQPWKYVDGQRRPLDFEDLAANSVGVDKIGVLKMDVDNLGDIFTKGLKREGEEVIELARQISLSRQMELFFKLYIDEICYGNYGDGLTQIPPKFSSFKPVPEKPSDWRTDPEWGLKGRQVAIVYSGGDDLFLVGAWSDAAEIAFDIHRAFKAYTAGNPEVDLSAGLVLTAKNYPLYHMADLAKRALDKAKDHKEKIGSSEFRKASVSLFYTPQAVALPVVKCAVSTAIKWQRLENATNWATADDVLELVGLFNSFRQDVAVANGQRWQLDLSRSFIRDLFRIVRVYRRSGKLYLPRLAYLLAEPRLAPGAESGGKMRKAWELLKAELMQHGTVRYLGFALTWVDLLCRPRK